MLAGDWDKVLTYTSPAYRQTTTAQRYAGGYAGIANWTAAKVDRVDCTELRCEVVYLVTYQMTRPNIENTRPLQDLWISANGDWYIYEE